MTSQSIKFYKLNSGSSKLAGAKTVEGAIIYVVDARELWIGGATPKLVIKGANDVTFANNVLTLTHYDNAGHATTDTLDFSDVASAEATFKVFDSVWSKMGATTSGTSKVLDYTGTKYLTSATNLVDADKALDTAIHTNTRKGAATGANYDTQHLSQTWAGVVSTNAIAANDTLDADIDKLDKKVAGLADEVIANEQVTQEAFTAVANSVGLEQNMSLDLSADSLKIIKDDKSVKEALIDLDDYVATKAGKVDDVKINDTTIVLNKIANIAVDGTYDATDNKIATESTVENAIDALVVNEYAQAEIDATTTSGETAFKVKGIKEVDGKIEAGTNTVGLKIDGTYNASTNMIATESTVSNAIDALNVNTDKGAASISGSTITINAVQQENGKIKDGGSTTISLDGTYNAETNKIATQDTVKNAIGAIAGAGLAVDNAGIITATTQQTADDTTNVATTEFVHNVVETLDGSATIASVSNNVVTIKTGVTEADGVISNDTGTDIVLEEVAVTGAASDVAYSNTQSQMSATNVQAAIDALDTRLDSLEGDFNIVISTDAATTPLGVKWMDGETEITGTLQPSADTYHDIYLVPAGGSEGANTYKEYITTRSGVAGSYTYTWEKLGDIAVDLTGYVKTVTVNGKQYAVDANSTNVTLTDVITAINGETAIASGNTNFVKVTATTTKTEADGTNVTELSTTAKVQAVASADASNQGLAEASDVKAYVDGEIQKLDVTEYAQAEITTTSNASTLKVKGIKEEDGKIAAGTNTVDVEIDGVYNATNKVATQSTVTNAINDLDKNPTTTTGTNVSVTYSETDGIVTVDSVSESYATITRTAKSSGVTPNLVVTSGDENKLVKASDVANAKLYTDDKIADEIEKLDATVSSQQPSVATVQVVEADGVITTVNVTTQSAGVTYTRSQQAGGESGATANLTATTSTGAVTGADIATIKSYVDDKAILCWEEYE